MKFSRMAVLIAASVPLFTAVALAASSNDAKVVGGCAACSSVILLPIIIQVAILTYVVKDARKRGVESALGWAAFVALVPLVGLLVYLSSRPPLKTW